MSPTSEARPGTARAYTGRREPLGPRTPVCHASDHAPLSADCRPVGRADRTVPHKRSHLAAMPGAPIAEVCLHPETGFVAGWFKGSGMADVEYGPAGTYQPQCPAVPVLVATRGGCNRGDGGSGQLCLPSGHPSSASAGRAVRWRAVPRYRATASGRRAGLLSAAPRRAARTRGKSCLRRVRPGRAPTVSSIRHTG